jgi:hypothetical protein
MLIARRAHGMADLLEKDKGDAFPGGRECDDGFGK